MTEKNTAAGDLQTKRDEKGLQRLLAAIDDQEIRKRYSSEHLVVEVDGSAIQELVPQQTPTKVQLPADGEELVLRDEMGTIRAFALLAEDRFQDLDFDAGRLRLSLEENEQGQLWLGVSSTQASMARARLAAAPAPAPERGEDSLDLVKIAFTDQGMPKIDGDGYFVMEAFCRPELSGRHVRIRVADILDFEDVVGGNGFLRIVREAPAGTTPSDLNVEDLVVILV